MNSDYNISWPDRMSFGQHLASNIEVEYITYLSTIEQCKRTIIETSLHLGLHCPSKLMMFLDLSMWLRAAAIIRSYVDTTLYVSLCIVLSILFR